MSVGVMYRVPPWVVPAESTYELYECNRRPGDEGRSADNTATTLGLAGGVHGAPREKAERVEAGLAAAPLKAVTRTP